MYKEPIFFFLKIFVKMGESSLFLQAKQSCRNRPSCIGNELLLKFLIKVILLYAKVFLLCHAFDYLTVIVALYRSRLINLTGFYMRRGLIIKELKTWTSFSFRSSHSQKFFKIGILKNFAIFTRKHLCWSLFLIKLLAFSHRPATDSNISVLLLILRNFQHQLFYRIPRVATSIVFMK